MLLDDLVSTLWLFAWLTKQPLFSDLTDTNIRSILAAKTEAYISESMMPFGEMSDGQEEDEFDWKEELNLKKFGGTKEDPMLKWIME